MIGPRGIPIMGRSVCYRFAAPVPLLASAERGGPEWSRIFPPAVARRAMDVVWSYFVGHGGIVDGEMNPRVFVGASSRAGQLLWAVELPLGTAIAGDCVLGRGRKVSFGVHLMGGCP